MIGRIASLIKFLKSREEKVVRVSIIKFLKKLASSHSPEQARSPPNENYIKVFNARKMETCVRRSDYGVSIGCNHSQTGRRKLRQNWSEFACNSLGETAIERGKYNTYTRYRVFRKIELKMYHRNVPKIEKRLIIIYRLHSIYKYKSAVKL